ncbi:MAG: hypothetical protein ACLTXT_03545 [Ruminococcus callidus]
MKVKLILIDTFRQSEPPQPLHYFIPKSQNHLRQWRYPPEHSPRIIETIFDLCRLTAPFFPYPAYSKTSRNALQATAC